MNATTSVPAVPGPVAQRPPGGRYRHRGPYVRSAQVSAKQLEANRRNALRSTGPRTAAGKARVAQNAIKHGARAASAVLPDEDPAGFAEFLRETLRDHQPVGTGETECVERIADVSWRL